MISELIALREGDDRLSEDELIATCILLLFAGHETTTNLLANGLLSLMRFPQQMDTLRQQPEWVTHAVEELLRFEGPRARKFALLGKPMSCTAKNWPWATVFLSCSMPPIAIRGPLNTRIGLN